MKKLTFPLIFVIAIFLLSVCLSNEAETQLSKSNGSAQPVTQSTISPTTSPIKENNSMKGFLFSNTNQTEQIFLNWTNQDNKLNGSMQYSRAEKSGNNIAIETDSFPFTGIVSKDSVSLNFTGGFFNTLNGSTITGTLNGKTLTLYFPDKDGLLNELPFKESSVQEYNSAIQMLSEKIQNTNEQNAEMKAIQEQEVANQRQKEKEQNAVIQANNSLQSMIVKLQEQLTEREDFESQFTVVIASYETHWKQMNEYKQKLIAASKVTPFNSDQYYIVQDINYNIGDAKYLIDDDTYQFKDIEWRISNYLTDLQDALDEINKRWVQLKTASSQNTIGSPKPQFTEEEILTLTKSIQDEMNKTTSLLVENQEISVQYQEKAEKLSDEMFDYLYALEVE
jgi:hypothetical protein